MAQAIAGDSSLGVSASSSRFRLAMSSVRSAQHRRNPRQGVYSTLLADCTKLYCRHQPLKITVASCRQVDTQVGHSMQLHGSIFALWIFLLIIFAFTITGCFEPIHNPIR